MNNICNYEEGCSLPSSTKYDLLIEQLKREIETLANTTEAKLLCHDGKIAEMCKYIKDNLSNTIRDLLDSMKLSGELDSLIQESIIEFEKDFLNTKSKVNYLLNSKNASDINLHRISRILNENGSSNRTDFDTTKNYFSKPEGFCIINDTTCAITYSNTGNNANNNLSKLAVVDINSGAEIDSIIFNGGHANSVTYIPSKNELIVCDCYYRNSDGSIQTTNNIHVFNASYLKDNRLVEVNVNEENVTSVTYDRVTNKLYLCGNKIFELSLTDYGVCYELPFEYDKELKDRTRQAVIINDGIVYVETLGVNIISKYTLCGKLLEQYNIPLYIDNLYWTGEIQGIDYVNNQFYGIAYHQTNYEIATVANIITFTLDKNTLIQYPETYTQGNNIELYVDKNSISGNPNGSINNKFKEMYEAIEMATSPILANRKIKIIGVAGQRYDYFVANNLKNISIENGDISCSINGCNLIISNAVIYKGDENNYPINILNGSNVTLSNVSFDESKTYDQTLCKVIDSKLKLVGIIQSEFNPTITAYSLDYGSEFLCRVDIANIEFLSPNIFIDSKRYKISKGDIAIQNGIIEYNDYMKNKGLNYNIERFDSLLIEYEVYGTGYRYFERITKNNYINIHRTNMSDGSNNKPLIYETTIELNNNNMNVKNNKFYDMNTNEFGNTNTLVIKNIYLCY